MLNGNAKATKVVVVGLDGATLNLIRPWAAAGLLPNLSNLMAGGAWGPLRTVIPPITGPAWTSLATGQNPGKHGIYDFLSRRPGSYDLISVNASRRRSPSLWGLLSQAGRKAGVLNVPLTYPPEPVNGFMVTGMLTPPEAADFCYPAELGEQLRQAVPDYVIQPGAILEAKGREAELVEALQAMTDMRRRAALHLLGHTDWDFFMVVFMATDVVQHACWHFMDATHRDYDPTAAPALSQAIQSIYQQVDDTLGQIVAELDDQTYLFVMSDHGFGPLENYFHVNVWLWREGFLHFQNSPTARLKQLLFRAGLTPLNTYRWLRELGLADRLARTAKRQRQRTRGLLGRAFLSFDDVDWQRTRAYSVGNVGPIYVNLRGREPQGIVEPGQDYEELLAEISATLLNVPDPLSGRPLIERVYGREELYSGPHLAEAPDLFFIPRNLRTNAFGALQFPSSHWLEPPFDRTGGHQMDGILLAKGPGIRPGYQVDGARIIDLAPTILSLLDVPIPDDVDGHILSTLFTDELAQGLQPVFTHVATVAPNGHHPLELPAAAEEAVRARLQGLGYL
ncbi:MAG: alkaline phosphatase family protein [Chloroflexota bacterium]